MKILTGLSRDKLLKLLAIIVLSDGTISKKGRYLCSIKLETLPSNECQHDLFYELCKKIYRKKPNRLYYKNNGKRMLCSRLFGKKYILELFRMSPTYQTTPGPKFSNIEFLRLKQPSLSFLFNDSKKLKIIALRIWFDFDGSIVPLFKLKEKKDNKNGKEYRYFQVQFECEIHISETNPNLAKELVTFCSKIGLKANLVKSKRKWSNIEGIRISNLESIKRFIDLGGPITDVRISSKSKRFKGITKLVVCQAVKEILNSKRPLSFYFKTREDAISKRLDLSKSLISEIKRFS